MNRRDFIVGTGAFGITLPTVLKAQTSGATPKAQSVIHIYLPGGMAHQESWDYKPQGTSDYRGPLQGIKTKINDVFFSELFKNTADISDELVVIRSMTHGEAAHERGTHNMLTGYRPSPAIKYPSFGSVISHELGTRNSIPPYVIVPNQFAPENGSGYLSTAFGPFSIGSNPENPNFSVKDLQPPADISEDRFNRRTSLLGAVDEHFRKLEKSDSLNAIDKFYQQAYDLISSTQAREAFSFKGEQQKTIDMYGDNDAGKRLLLARRLVQAGVRLVTVTYGGWDHHANIKSAMTSNSVKFDKAFSGLITDLKRTGMLDSTLVIVSSEFGRTPKINSSNGRDHWPRVFSVVMAGGGLKKGVAYGTSNALAAEPEDNPVSPEELAATMYHLIGINPRNKLMTTDLRPIEIVYNALPIKDIIV